MVLIFASEQRKVCGKTEMRIVTVDREKGYICVHAVRSSCEHLVRAFGRYTEQFCKSVPRKTPVRRRFFEMAGSRGEEVFVQGGGHCETVGNLTRVSVAGR